jgi:cephalosporin hydroxylase
MATIRPQPRVDSDPRPEAPRDAESVVDEFHRLFHYASKHTWETTTWMGTLVQKLPMDLVILQEIVHETRPDLIVETGVRYGGTTLFFANLFDLLGAGRVIGIDTDLSDTRTNVRDHPRVTLIEGSSTDPAVVARVTEDAKGKRVMVDLDSDHSAEHVLAELRALAPLVSPGCYLVVEDTNLNANPVVPEFGPGPAEALAEWLAEEPPFVVDSSRERLLVSFNPGGYLRRRGDAGAPTAPAPADSGAQPEPDGREPAAGALEAQAERLQEARENLTALQGIAESRRRELERLAATHEEAQARAAALEADVRGRDEELVELRRRLDAVESSLPYRVYRRVHSALRGSGEAPNR